MPDPVKDFLEIHKIVVLLVLEILFAKNSVRLKICSVVLRPALLAFQQ